MFSFSPRQSYSPAESFSDLVVHVSGVGLAAVAAPVLVALAIWLHGSATAVASASVYGLTLLAMLLCSALYNTVGQRRFGPLLKRLDHSAIYTKIAGTYTPLGLLAGGHGATLVAGLWVVAAVGTTLKMLAPDRLRWAGLALYILMGWAGVFAGGDIFAALSTPVFALILTGGLIYTGGVLLYLFERMPFHYTAWHVCVLAATMVFYAAITLHLVQTAPSA
jgi:hemolysin III